jgi:hypothetical protein
MLRPRRLACLLLLAGLTTVAVAAPANAAKRRVPFGFFGVVAPPRQQGNAPVSDAALEQQMAVMARSGVESFRIIVSWAELEPAPGVYNFTAFDRFVAAAAPHRLLMDANVTLTPQWISEQPNSPEYYRYPPRDPKPFAALMRQLVLRYGPRGTFWAQHPNLPRVPVRQWQIWNEQTAFWYWPQPYAPSYTRLLKPAYRAIHGADRGAKVVAGSFVGFAWVQARDLYRAGAKRYFDTIAIHPFTNISNSVNRTVSQVVEIVRRVRAEMRRRGDGHKPIILTEVTWAAALGRLPYTPNQWVETTPRGQAQRLTGSYRALARLRRQLGVTQAYWFTWATEYDAAGPSSIVSFRYTGLNRVSSVGVRDVAFAPMPLLGTYSALAASYEGCRKSTNALRCR